MTVRLSSHQAACLKFVKRFGPVKNPRAHAFTAPTYEVLWRRGYILFQGMDKPVSVTAKGKGYLE